MAALPAHRALVRRLGNRPARAARARCTPRSARSSTFPIGTRSFTLRTRADRIERLRDGSYAILDYKTGVDADREAGAHRPFAAAHARRRDPARGRLRRDRAGRLDRRVRLCVAARRRAAGRTEADRVQGRHAGQPRRRALARLKAVLARFERERRALPLAGQPDVEDALRRLRPSGAREGVVGGPARRTTE